MAIYSFLLPHYEGLDHKSNKVLTQSLLKWLLDDKDIVISQIFIVNLKSVFVYFFLLSFGAHNTHIAGLEARNMLKKFFHQNHALSQIIVCNLGTK